MPRRLAFSVFLLLVSVVFVRAQDVQNKPTMGVLDATLVGKGFDPELRPVFTSLVRGKVVDLVHDSVDVMEGSKLERLVATNAVSCSNASCLVQFARTIGVDYLLETRLLYRKGSWTATVKLASAGSSSLVSEKTTSYADEGEAQKRLPDLASQAVASLVKGGSASVGAVSEDVPLAPPPAGAVKVIVKFGSVPEGAAVSVDGHISCTSTPCKRPFLEGTHRVEMVKDGYRSRRESVALSRNGQEVSWMLSAIQARLSLDAMDDRTGDALIGDVYVDGARVGQTPYDGLVAVGAQKIEVAPEGYSRQTVSVTLEEGKTASATAHFKSVEKPKVVETPDQLRDSRDGQTYRTVTIGSQTWMAQNLNYATGNSWCYDNNPSNCAKYGRLYDWATAKAACPEGWHLPSDGEWSSLENVVGSDAGKKLKSSSSWDGTDAYGFNVLPSGARGNDGSFLGVGSVAYFWSSSEFDAQDAWSRDLNSGLDALCRNGYYYETDGFSVRCLKD